jgi:hypothetical protein
VAPSATVGLRLDLRGWTERLFRISRHVFPNQDHEKINVRWATDAVLRRIVDKPGVTHRSIGSVESAASRLDQLQVFFAMGFSAATGVDGLRAIMTQDRLVGDHSRCAFGMA